MTVWKLVACAVGAAAAGAVVDAAGRRACPPCVVVPCPPGETCPLPPAPDPVDAPAEPTVNVELPASRRF